MRTTFKHSGCGDIALKRFQIAFESSIRHFCPPVLQIDVSEKFSHSGDHHFNDCGEEIRSTSEPRRTIWECNAPEFAAAEASTTISADADAGLGAVAASCDNKSAATEQTDAPPLDAQKDSLFKDPGSPQMTLLTLTQISHRINRRFGALMPCISHIVFPLGVLLAPQRCMHIPILKNAHLYDLGSFHAQLCRNDEPFAFNR
jgi:hypothetical protein